MNQRRKSTQTSQRAEALFHPVRFRIVKILESGRMTPVQIRQHLPEVAQATLYRHINKLQEAGIIEVVETHPVHGTVERVFSLVREQSVLTYGDLTTASPDELNRFSRLFLDEIAGSFERYFQANDVDLQRDAIVLYEQVVYLSPEEAQEVRAQMRNLIDRYVSNPPGNGRYPRSLAALSVPEAGNEPPQKTASIERDQPTND